MIPLKVDPFELLLKYTLAIFMLIGLVNIVQMAIDKKWDSFIKAMMAVIAGGIFGYLKYFGLPSIEIGLAVGMASSGVYKAIQINATQRIIQTP